MLDVQIDYKKIKKKVNIFHRSLKTYYSSCEKNLTDNGTVKLWRAGHVQTISSRASQEINTVCIYYHDYV